MSVGERPHPGAGPRLLAADEPSPFTVLCPGGASPFVFTADHAGLRIPRALGDLGVSEAERRRHIAWDLGVAGVLQHLAPALDAFAALQTYSRLVIDANRRPGTEGSIVTRSERTAIPGNEGLGAEEVRRRADELFYPYHHRIAAELDARAAAGRETVLVTLHSFTPVFLDVPRPWHAGVLHDRERRLGQALLPLLRAEPGLCIGENQPYAACADNDYGLMVHGEARGLLCVELELRQDLLADEAGQRQWAARLARLLPQALAAAARQDRGAPADTKKRA